MDKVRINIEQLNLSQQKIVNYVIENGKVTNKEVQELLGIKESRSLKILKELTGMGVLVKRGKLKGSIYILDCKANSL